MNSERDQSDSLFSSENSLVLRGLAILAIMYHNLLHTKFFGFSVENEMSFSYDKVDAFMYAMSTCRNWGADIVSFLGWLGVPVFVFLSGYGLSKKYLFRQSIQKQEYISNSTLVLNGKKYIRHSYLKLFLLMLPAVLFFMIIDIAVHDYSGAAKKLFSLTLFSNFDYPLLHYSPGVYWYFSLTFQYYVLFYLFHNRFKGFWLFLWSVLSLIVLAFLSANNSSWLLSVYRHCFTGWFPLFALGIWLGRHSHASFLEASWLKSFFLVVCSFLLILVMSLNLLTWTIVPIVALVFFMALSNLVLKIDWIRNPLKWVGQYSAFIFVCHPIARIVANRLCGAVPLWGILVVYFLLTMLLAIIYGKLYKRLIVLFKV